MSEELRKHNSHAAESWRELAGDVRQWADGHRLAITATVALVVLNLVVWLVVAMAGFAFPLAAHVPSAPRSPARSAA